MAEQTENIAKMATVLTGSVLPLSNLLFLGVNASVTISGFFINNAMVQTGSSFTATILQGSGSNNPSAMSDIYAQALPTDATAASVIITGDVYWALSNGSTADFKANYVNYPKFLAGDGYIPLGRSF